MKRPQSIRRRTLRMETLESRDLMAGIEWVSTPDVVSTVTWSQPYVAKVNTNGTQIQLNENGYSFIGLKDMSGTRPGVLLNQLHGQVSDNGRYLVFQSE